MEKRELYWQIGRAAQTYLAEHCVLKYGKCNRKQWARCIILGAVFQNRAPSSFWIYPSFVGHHQWLVWWLLCDLVCVNIIWWSFLCCFGVFLFTHFFLYWKKNNQSIFVKRVCTRPEDVNYKLSATFHKAGLPCPFSHPSPSLTSYFGQVLLSWKLASCPTFSQNKQQDTHTYLILGMTLNPKRLA